MSSSSSAVHDADALTAPVVMLRGSKLVGTGEVVSIAKSAEAVESVRDAIEVLANVTDVEKLAETATKQYCVLVMHNTTESALMLTKAQEKGFVRRAYAKSGATGNVPWQALAAGKKVPYLGSTMTLSKTLAASVLEKKAKEEPVAPKPAQPKPEKIKKPKKRPRTPSVSSESEEEEEEEDCTETEVEDDDESIALEDYEDEDNQDLIDEDGGCQYSMTITGKTPRAFKLAVARLHASLN